MAGTTARFFTEQCANCGQDVKFDAETIHRENPYWPWLEAKHVDKFTEELHAATIQISALNDTIRTPNAGLISTVGVLVAKIADLSVLIAELVVCFKTLLVPSPTPAPATPVDSEDPR